MKNEKGQFTREPTREEVAEQFAQHLGIIPTRVPRNREEMAVMLMAGLSGASYEQVDQELEARGFQPPVREKTEAEFLREELQALRADLAKLGKSLTRKDEPAAQASGGSLSAELAALRTDFEQLGKSLNGDDNKE